MGKKIYEQPFTESVRFVLENCILSDGDSKSKDGVEVGIESVDYEEL